MAFIDRLHARRRYLVRLSVRSGERIVVIDAPDVDWIEAADNYVKLHVGAREYVLRETLGALERRIDPDEFVRIHRSAIVRIDRVAELHPASHGDVDLRLQDGTRLTLSRTFRDRVERALGHRLP